VESPSSSWPSAFPENRQPQGRLPLFVGEARRISTLANPNVAPRFASIALARRQAWSFFWEFIDGERLLESWLSAALPLEIALRLILDVPRGSRRNPRPSRRKATTDANLLTVSCLQPRSSWASTARGARSLARLRGGGLTCGARPGVARLSRSPRVHAGGAYDGRADVFSAGVMLWEALASERLFRHVRRRRDNSRAWCGGVPPRGDP